METIDIILIAAIFIPVVFYAIKGLAHVTITNNIDEFYFNSGHAKNSSYTQSTVAYMLQTATTFYFIYWGYNYGFGNLFYIITWMLGILLLRRFSGSIAGLLKQNFNSITKIIAPFSNVTVKHLVSIVSIVGFAAIIFIETHFASILGNEIVSSNANVGNTSSWWLFFFAFLIICFIYSIYGGISKVYYTDKIQLGSAYIGFSLLFAFLLIMAYSHSPISAIIINVLIALVLFVMLYGDYKRRDYGIKFNMLTISFIIITIAILVGVNISDFSTGNSSPIQGLFSQLNEKWGWVTLLGFTITNVFWQFCDNSNFQRLSSIKEELDEKQLEEHIKKAITSTVLSSPITWSFGIFLGILISISGLNIGDVSPDTGFIGATYSLAVSGNYFALVGLVGFAVAISSIMLSTVDSSLLTIMQLWEIDLNNHKETTAKSRLIISTIFFMVIMIMGYLINELELSNIFTFINGAYAQMLVLAFPVFFKLLGVDIPPIRIIIMIVVGSVTSWLFTFYLPNWDWNILLVLPTLACFISSILAIIDILIIQLLISKRK